MKNILILYILSGTYLFGQNVIDEFVFDINKLKLPVTNAGIIGENSLQSYGTYDGYSFLFFGGFMLSGKQGDSVWSNGTAIQSWWNDYLPGNVGADSSDPKNKIYVIKATDPPFGQSWQNWADAVSQGADFYDGDGDNLYNPVDLNSNGMWDPNEDSPGIFSRLTAWYVYNDRLPQNERRLNDVGPQGIEIQHTIFAEDNDSMIENIVYHRYRIINKGTVSSDFDSIYFGLWMDPDIGDYSDDKAGSDTLLNSGFVYNSMNDNQYGINPPSFFAQIIQGPYAFIPGISYIDQNQNNIYEPGIDTPLDSAFNMKGKHLGIETVEGAANLPMSSFLSFISGYNGLNVISNKVQARNLLQGKTTQGNYIDPCNFPYGVVYGEECSAVTPYFHFSGDPINNSGWLNNNEQDQRFLNSSGPFVLKENEPVDIIVAYVVGRGYDHLNSVIKAGKMPNMHWLITTITLHFFRRLELMTILLLLKILSFIRITLTRLTRQQK